MLSLKFLRYLFFTIVSIVLATCVTNLWWRSTSLVPAFQPSLSYVYAKSVQLDRNWTVPVDVTTYDICDETDLNTKSVFLLAFMLSAPVNYDRRAKQRESCLNVSEVSGKRIERVFLLGNSGDLTLYAGIKEESMEFHDIVMGDFHDSYKNLTMKTIAGLKWASLYCPQAQYVMKVDDDVLINFKTLVDQLTSAPREDFITGCLNRGSRPFRDEAHKFYVSYQDYPRDVYPDYLHGLGYIMSGELPAKIVDMSLTTPIFLWEDVYIGIILEKLKIRPQNNPCFIIRTRRMHIGRCTLINGCLIHYMNPDMFFGQCHYLKEAITNTKIEC